jgi:ketosteroid isomerase-like protein
MDTSRRHMADRMEQRIRDYFDACNSGDADAVAAHFTQDAVHYFPPGMYGGPFRGAVAIGERWAWAVATFGSNWSVDEVICDPDTHRAVIEWTHAKPSAGVVLRGDEWYRFDADTGLITEIRAYYASPQASGMDRLELAGFPYGERGYRDGLPHSADDAADAADAVHPARGG